MSRKLASVVLVGSIAPIPDADNIELAKINGWQCVVQKGLFLPHTLAAYLEIDSVPPDIAAFRWLWQPRALKVGTLVRVLKNGAPGTVTEFIDEHSVMVELDAGVHGPFGIHDIESCEPRPSNFRIKTIRLKGCLSQGLLVPLKDLWVFMGNGAGINFVSEGDDLTDALGVTEYDPQID